MRARAIVCSAALCSGLFASACDVYVDSAPAPQVARQAPPPPRIYAPAPPPPRRRIRHRPLPRDASASPTAAAPPDDEAAGVCLDTGPAPTLDCSTMASPDPSCAPFPQARERCAAYQTNFDPKVAAAAVYCMTLLSSKEVCDPAQATSCATRALTDACDDPAVVQLCRIASGPCKTSPAECSTLLSGLNDGGQEAVAQCVARGCAGGLTSCIDALPAGAIVP
jgi:hypothetical protein